MQIVQKEAQELMKQVAKELNVPLSSVAEVISSQFEFVAESISSVNIADASTYKQINIPYFGKFILPPKKGYTINEFFKRKKEAKDNEKHN